MLILSLYYIHEILVSNWGRHYTFENNFNLESVCYGKLGKIELTT
jgi:hypothetical protein